MEHGLEELLQNFEMKVLVCFIQRLMPVCWSWTVATEKTVNCKPGSLSVKDRFLESLSGFIYSSGIV